MADEVVTSIISDLPAKTPSGSMVLAIEDGNSTGKATIDDAVAASAAVSQLNSQTGAGIAWHNSFFRGKYLGSSISTAQNTAIKNRTYDDLFVGDYWKINDVNWRIAAVDYYWRTGDTAYARGNIIVVPDAPLYNHQMCWTETGAYVSGAANNITTGGYTKSHMFADNMNGGVEDSSYGAAGLTQARTAAASAFGSHVATHRVICTNATSNGKPSGWAWRDSDGVELMNEVQVYGTRAWGAGDQNGYDVGSQYRQLPLFRFIAPHINYSTGGWIYWWLQDVGSALVFADVSGYGNANHTGASYAGGVRPAVTLTYT